ncbi:MAG: hypothetical protein OEV60_02695 [Actinomycetota bacterium]|nr:hypothetical protein [Actinomycetota bacterium]MDH5224639.1 hypothetical protein [Actinomycetota bacterium]MDH5312848.1 hypothetical protein [Actinomycetota bacterium]
MTRYLCAHPGHERKGRTMAVDVTAQVRLEREFLPRESAYLASTDDVLSRVSALRSGDAIDRLAQVRRILTGTTAPIDVPVVLAARSTDRVPGLYELDELRRSDGAIADLIDRRFHASPDTADIVVLSDEGSEPATGAAAPAAETMTATQLERVQRARVLPQGIFPVMELSARIADARPDEDSIVEAIKATPTMGTPLAERTDPWRVVIECPTPVGDPPVQHRMVFTGTGDHEPAEVLGTPAVGWDSALEDAATLDLAPPTPSRRGERRLKAVLLAELVIGALVAGLAWASGALAQAVRETPGWMGFAVTLGVAAFAIGSIALLGRSDADGNANDTFVLRRHYASRAQLIAASTMLSAGIFALALTSAIVPPVLDAEAPVPAPIITFAAGNRVVTATVQLDGRDIATDDLVTVEMRQYSADQAEGVLIGRVTATGNSAGRVTVSEAMALDRGARYMSVLVIVGDRSTDTCTPAGATGTGCTVVSVPPLGAGVIRFVPAPSLEALIQETETTPIPTTAPSPSISPSPVATTSPAASVSPAASTSPAA